MDGCQLFTSYQDLVNGAPGQPFVSETHLPPRTVVGQDGYEGGEDRWECSIDLARYIHDTKEGVFKDKPSLKVLELGCGDAGPSIALAKERAQAELKTELVLQERDERALHYTETSLRRDFTSLERPFVTVKLLSSDWAEMEPVKVVDKFDVVLMSETLYRLETFPVVTKIVQEALAPGHGLCISAQKRFYFGVGGGSLPFKSFLATKPDSLKMEMKLQLNENNQRDIAVLTVV